MRKNIFLFISISIMLTGCSTDKQIGQSVLSTTPVVFLISMGFQYLFFRIWKQKWPELTMFWLPNFVFLFTLTLIALIFGRTEGMVFSNTLTTFGSSYLTVLFILTRIWLFFSRSKVFTWASIVILSLFILPAFPMIAGITQGTPFFATYVFPLWVYLGTVSLNSSTLEYRGFLTVLVFLALIFEAWLKTRKKVDDSSQ